MGFRINNNISALTAQGNLNKTQGGLAKSIERLSSGLKINRGADDAAGLTISEKLRGQIRGLNRAVTNAQDGISLIQTAEGALNEDASILNRMRELAIQSQEDALTSNDRLEIQKEIDQLVDEVDRISKTTEFNTKKLLDGTASALVSTNASGLQAYQTGDAGQASAGDYKVKVALEEAGVRQVQMSAIMARSDNGNVASLGTQLKDLESFYDNDGNNVLEKPETITIRGNGQKVDVTISSDMTLQDLTSAIESEVNKEIEDGGLGLKGSTFAFNAQKGQIIFESGREGSTGEIAIAASEDLTKALGFQVTTESEDSAYKVSATTVNTQNAVTTSVNTTTDRASGAIAGLDLKFDLASQARMDGSVAATETITVGDTDIYFAIGDTNNAAGATGGPENKTAGATQPVGITLSANRTFTLSSIENIVNDAISSAGNGPAVTASFDGYNLKLTSSAVGTSAAISVSATGAASDLLGLRTGKIAGTSGTSAILSGTVAVQDGIDVGTANLTLQIGDGDGNIASAITFMANTQVSAISMVDHINNNLSANNVKAEAILNSEGKLEIQATETGSDSRVSIASSSGNLNVMGFISGQSDIGEGGNAAVLVGVTHESAQTIGYTFDGQMSFTVTDKNGASSGTITIVGGNAANGIDNVTENFSISQASLATLLDNSNLNTTDVAYSFDAGGRLDFSSRSTGENSRIILSSPTANPEYVTFGRNALGLDVNSSAQGSGKTDFDLHVADRSLTFQIGANQQQQLNFEIINTSADALGLTGLDITNIDSATRALGAIDDAVQSISSERSKLGSLQNRMNSTINNLTVTSTNLQSTESKIRDVDVAQETVEFTRNQILIQAGTAQLAQAKGLPQNALQLLG